MQSHWFIKYWHFARLAVFNQIPINKHIKNLSMLLKIGTIEYIAPNLSNYSILLIEWRSHACAALFHPVPTNSSCQYALDGGSGRTHARTFPAGIKKSNSRPSKIVTVLCFQCFKTSVLKITLEVNILCQYLQMRFRAITIFTNFPRLRIGLVYLFVYRLPCIKFERNRVFINEVLYVYRSVTHLC